MANNPEKLAKLQIKMLKSMQPDAYSRLQRGLIELQKDYSSRKFYNLFALTVRWFDKEQVSINKVLHKKWRELDRYGVLSSWEYAQLARLLLLIQLAELVGESCYLDTVNQLYRIADVNELVLLGQSLAFIPHAELFVDRARECARSNIVSVFCSVAHRSAYARTYFDNTGWNQLILKAAFLAIPIWSIVGLRDRNNAELVTMLKHYVSERQAANRVVPWDLWCCPGWLAKTDLELGYLRQQWQRADGKTQTAIALALTENEEGNARELGRQLLEQSEFADCANWPEIAELENL